MKLKSYRKKDGISDVFRDFYTADTAGETAISIDTNGCVILENFRRLVDYRKGVMTIETKSKQIYIHGDNLVLVSCSKKTAVCKGDIAKIEIFAKEV